MNTLEQLLLMQVRQLNILIDFEVGGAILDKNMKAKVAHVYRDAERLVKTLDSAPKDAK